MPATTEVSRNFCSLCKVPCSGANNLEDHINGKKHRRRLKSNPSNAIRSASVLPPRPRPVTTPTPPKGQEAVNCPTCKKVVAGREVGWKGHIGGVEHREKAARSPNYVEPRYASLPKIRKAPKTPKQKATPSPPQHSQYICVPCSRLIPLSSREAHARGGKHLKKIKIARIAASLAPGLPASSHPNTKLCTECRIILHVLDWPAHFRNTPHRTKIFTTEPLAGPSSNVRSQAQPPSKAKTTTKPAKTQNLTQTTPPQDSAQGPRTGGRVRKVWSRRGHGVLVPGVVAPHLELVPWIKKLGRYPIPENIETIFSSETPRFRKEFDEVSKKIPVTLSSSTYEQSWTTLLFVEEIQMRDDLSRYDMHGVPLTRHGLYYHLEVPGLAEKRPSVLVGDTFTVKAQGAPADGPSYEGHVHYVYQKEVGLRFDKRFQAQIGQLFDVEFQLNRMTLRRMHQALLLPMSKEDRQRILFPQVNRFQTVPHVTEMHAQEFESHIVNPLILNNPRQLLAVSAIRDRPAGSPPLIVWGPPGTGKTITAVEGIRQILLQDPGARILACAPSNSAADLIAQRLLDLGTDVLFRLNAPSRPRSLLPSELLPFTSVIQMDSKYPSDSVFYRNTKGGHEVFSCPPKEKVMEFRVIVSTCSQSGVPYGIGIPPGHFTHIFIDEAGQALEPDVMIPIKTMLVQNTNLILCGDPKQLGPVVHSPIAKQLGFGTSFLERLVNLPAYDHTSTKLGVAIIRLTQNFRSHPFILKFPSDEFYDGAVLPYGMPNVINSLVDWEGLPRKGFPIIFHAIKGENLQEATSPSYFNPHEASVVKEYVERLQSIGLSHSDVGIIAPYRAQCQKIRKLVNSDDRSEAKYKVGSVEEFQGQERKVIIVSTVRSDQNLANNFDKKHSLGFVAQERRFNVAVTRAQALLILVGDPGVLRLDRVWWAFMNYVYLNGGWCGAPIEWDPQGEFDPDGPRTGDDSGLPDEDLDYPPPADATWAQHRE